MQERERKQSRKTVTKKTEGTKSRIGKDVGLR